MNAVDRKRNEASLQGYLDRMAQAPDLRELDGLAAEAGGYLEGMVELGGYPALSGEGWAARIRKAKQARQRQLTPRKPNAVNRYGLDTDYFRRKLIRLQRDLDSYTPDEFARTCARMARTADAAVLAEAEFVDGGGQ